MVSFQRTRSSGDSWIGKDLRASMTCCLSWRHITRSTSLHLKGSTQRFITAVNFVDSTPTSIVLKAASAAFQAARRTSALRPTISGSSTTMECATRVLYPSI
jgi:hypothetical protein